MLKLPHIFLLAALAAAPAAQAKKLLFSDDFETNTSANWSIFNASDTGTPDFTAQFNFLYTTNTYPSNSVSRTVPLAPNSVAGAGRGVKLTVNKNDNVAERSAVNIYPKSQVFSNNYSLQFDMFLSYNGPAFGGTGSTEFAMFGINHSGTGANWEPASTSVPLASSDGVWFAVTGEGGAAGDYRSYEGDPLGNPLRYKGPDGGFLDRDGDGAFDDESVPGMPTDSPLAIIFPTPPYESLAVPGKSWVQVEIRQKDGVITWLINNYVIAEKQNLSQWTMGNVMLGTMDIFSSIASPKADNYVIYDNVRVYQLEPGDDLPRVGVEVSDGDAAEPRDPATFTISRTGPTTNPLTVKFKYFGTAKAGEDFGPNTNSIVIPAGAASVPLVVTPIDDAKAEATETIVVGLQTDSAAGYEIGEKLRAAATLADDGDVTQVSATATSSAIAYEGIPDQKAYVSISRNGDPTGDLIVNLTTSGTAARTDFFGLPTEVLIPAGQSNVLVEVQAIANTTKQPDRSVVVTVAPGNGYQPASGASSAAITIREAGTLLFSDNFDVNDSADWTLLFGANNNIADYTALFGYDYGADNIPSAPHSPGATTKGLKLTVNKNDATGSAAGVNVYPKGKVFQGNYLVRFDMYLTWSSAVAGTTEHADFGINHTGSLTNRHDTAGSDGVWFALEGDASGNRSYAVYTTTNTGQKPAFTSKNYTLFTTAFPAPPALKAGSPSGQWSDVMIKQENNLIVWTINGFEIFVLTNTTGFTAGDMMLGYMDEFASIGSTNNYVLYDNVRVYDLGGTAPPTVINLSKNVSFLNSIVTLRFTASGGDPTQFKVESSPSVTGPYNQDLTATVTQTSPGNYQVTVAGGSRARFYRITY